MRDFVWQQHQQHWNAQPCCWVWIRVTSNRRRRIFFNYTRRDAKHTHQPCNDGIFSTRGRREWKVKFPHIAKTLTDAWFWIIEIDFWHLRVTQETRDRVGEWEREIFESFHRNNSILFSEKNCPHKLAIDFMNEKQNFHGLSKLNQQNAVTL